MAEPKWMANASKNPHATAGAAKDVSVAREGAGHGHPLSNLPFSLWVAGTAPAAQVEGSNYIQQQNTLRLPMGLRRGRITEARPELRGAPQPFRLYFMFNPETIQQQYAFDTSAMPTALESAENLNIPNYTQGASISFVLLFDRVYEMWKGAPHVVSGWKGPGQIGTLWDINALDRLVGVFRDPMSGRPLGPAQGWPVIVSFGSEGGGSVEFFGHINHIGIQHLMFDVNMTPTRTEVELSVMQSYLPAQGGGTTGMEAPPPGTGPTSLATRVNTTPTQAINSRT